MAWHGQGFWMGARPTLRKDRHWSSIYQSKSDVCAWVQGFPFREGRLQRTISCFDQALSQYMPSPLPTFGIFIPNVCWVNAFCWGISGVFRETPSDTLYIPHKSEVFLLLWWMSALQPVILPMSSICILAMLLKTSVGDGKMLPSATRWQQLSFEEVLVGFILVCLQIFGKENFHEWCSCFRCVPTAITILWAKSSTCRKPYTV